MIEWLNDWSMMLYRWLNFFKKSLANVWGEAGWVRTRIASKRHRKKILI